MTDEPDLDADAADSRDLRRWPIVKPTKAEERGFRAEERDDKERERLRAKGTWPRADDDDPLQDRPPAPDAPSD